MAEGGTALRPALRNQDELGNVVTTWEAEWNGKAENEYVDGSGRGGGRGAATEGVGVGEWAAGSGVESGEGLVEVWGVTEAWACTSGQMSPL